MPVARKRRPSKSEPYEKLHLSLEKAARVARDVHNLLPEDQDLAISKYALCLIGNEMLRLKPVYARLNGRTRTEYRWQITDRTGLPLDD